MKARELEDLTKEELLKRRRTSGRNFQSTIPAFNRAVGKHCTDETFKEDVARIEMALGEKELQVGKTS